MENVINFDLLKEYDGTLKEVLKVWQKQKSYSVDDTIQYKGNYLKCTTAGTSGTTTLNFTGLDVGDTITDGTVVWEIIEPLCNGISGSNNYSTEEQRIGTWIDGKPLYQRTYNGTTPNEANVLYNIFDITNVTSVADVCFISDGYIIGTSSTIVSLNDYANGSEGWKTRVVVSKAFNSIRGLVGSTLISSPIVVTIKYTKTTD